MKKLLDLGPYRAFVMNKKQFILTSAAVLTSIFLFFFTAFQLGTSIKLPYASLRPMLKSAAGFLNDNENALSEELLTDHITDFLTGFDPSSASSYIRSIGNIFSFVAPDRFAYRENFDEKLILNEKGKYVPVAPEKSLTPLPSETPGIQQVDPSIIGDIKIVDMTTLKGSNTNYNEYGGVKIKNKSKTVLDAKTFLEAKLPIHMDTGGPKVLIVHTHTTESFVPESVSGVSDSFTGRNLNPDENITKVGEVMCEVLKQNGIEVIHDMTVHDYPSYNGAYTRALSTINKNLEKYPTIEMVIDVHRDAVTMADGSPIKYTAQINGETAAQVMLVMGSNESSLKNPNWMENMKFAFQIEQKMNQDYPQLARPISISTNRYNGHATLGSMILEVGTHVNTLNEAILGAKCAAQSIADVLNSAK